MREPAVVIAGCGAISAVGCGVDALWHALKNNLSGLNPSEKFNSPRFQSHITGTALTGEQAGTDDPAWLLATEALREARAEARNVLAGIPARRVGLVLSTTKANIEALERLTAGRVCSEAARRHLRADLLAADLAEAHGAQGPVQTVSVACVSGLVAIQQGTRLIQRGEADAVLVVGVDCLSEFVVAGFTALKALDPMGCRPFDAARCGLSPGEAGAAIILVRSDLAPQPAVQICGFGGSNDANHLTGPSRDGSGLAQAIRVALEDAKLTHTQIDYVHAHGTGTAYNDAMESLALQTIFGADCPPVSGSKGMIGHTLGAAGVIETIICALAMKGNFLPGTPRLENPAEGTPKSLVRFKAGEIQPITSIKTVLKLNTGFGGMNGALVLTYDGPKSRIRVNKISIMAASQVTEADLAGAGLGAKLGKRFGRLDLQSQLALLAVAALKVDFSTLPAERIAICLAASAGSLATDFNFWQGRDGAGGPSPTLFAYTLPSAAVGEIAIHFKLTGPNLCFVGDDKMLLLEAADLIGRGAADACLCVHCEVNNAGSAGVNSLPVAANARALYVQHDATGREWTEFDRDMKRLCTLISPAKSAV